MSHGTHDPTPAPNEPLPLGVRAAVFTLAAWVASFEMLKFPLSGVDGRHVGWIRWHDAMLQGTQGAPNRYRVLTPWLAELLHLCGMSVFNAYVALHLAAYTALGFALDRLWRPWLGGEARALGVTLVMLCMTLSYVPVIQPTDALNALFFALALDALGSRRWLRLSLLAIGASLNKQTAVFLAPLVFFHEALGDEGAAGRRVLLAGLRAGAVLACVMAVQAALVLSLGRADYYTDFWQVEGNLRWMSISSAGWNWIWMSVLPAALALATWRRQPRMLRAGALTMPLFVVAHALITVVAEVRVFTPMLALSVPSMLLLSRRLEPRGDHVALAAPEPGAHHR